MIDAVIACAYLAIMYNQKCRLSVACFSVFAMCVIVTSPMKADTNTGVMLSYCLYLAAYCALSYHALKKDHLPLAICAALIAFYDLIFAVDSLANPLEETLIWSHHEAFVLVLHAVLMCVLSQKLNSILRSGWYNLCMLFNFCKTCQPYNDSDRGQASKEVD